MEDKRCLAAFDGIVITDKTSSDRNATVDNLLCLPEPLPTNQPVIRFAFGTERIVNHEIVFTKASV